MRVDHRRLHALVAKQFLHRADVGPCFQQMGGEAMPQRVGRQRLGDPGAFPRRRERLAHAVLMHMMTTPHAGTRIDAEALGGKHPLPAPFNGRRGILYRERIGQPHARNLRRPVFVEEQPATSQMPFQVAAHFFRQHDDPILGSLAGTHHDLATGKIDVFDPQAQQLKDAQARPVEQSRHQPRGSFHGGKQPQHVLLGEHQRELRRTPRPDRVAHVAERPFQHLGKEKEQRRKRLVLRAGRNSPIHPRFSRKRRTSAVPIASTPTPASVANPRKRWIQCRYASSVRIA